MNCARSCAAFAPEPRTCPTVFTSRYADVLRHQFGHASDWDVVAVHRWYLYFSLVSRCLSCVVLIAVLTHFCSRVALGCPRTKGRLAACSSALAVCFFALGLVAPYSMLVTWNLALSPRAPVRALGGAAFWGGVVAWPGLFSLLGLYFAAHACFAAKTFAPTLPNRPRVGLGLFISYLGLCLAWTYQHPLPDAFLHASFKRTWGLAAPFLSPIAFARRYALDLLVNAGLVALFSVAVLFAARWILDEARLTPRLIDLAASTTLGTYVAHPYVLHVPTYLRLLRVLRRDFGELTRLVVVFALAAAFQLVVGPLFNVRLPSRLGLTLLVGHVPRRHSRHPLRGRQQTTL